MTMNTVTSFEQWKQSFTLEIDALPHTTAKGDAFVSKVMEIYYGLSEEDAINATSVAGPGDKGVDAIHIIEPEDGDGFPQAIIVQGKYGAAGTGLQLYQESQKFFEALTNSVNGQSVTTAIDQVAGIIKNGGQVRYLVATVAPLDETQRKDLDNIKKLAQADFGDKLLIEAINLKDLFNTLDTVEDHIMKKVELTCQVVSIQENAYVGAASLADIYIMLRKYAALPESSVDSIYDRNIRKYIKKKTGSVNEHIYATLKEKPSRFIAYNNGITIVCDRVKATNNGLELDNPYIVNGCQTTRTVYDYMNTTFAGINLADPTNKMASYKGSFMAIKVLVVGGDKSEEYTNEVTRYSNKQNAVKGKDFIALEDMYKRLKKELSQRGYFLETQVGEYDTLSKAQQQKYPKGSHLINSFEATLAYAAGILGRPHSTFGHSQSFTPGGNQYDAIVNDLKADDLLVPWLIAGQAVQLGYTKAAQNKASPDSEHRAQTRYFYLFLFFRLVRQALEKVSLPSDKDYILKVVRWLFEDYKKQATPTDAHLFKRLLTLTDETVFTYMELAKAGEWYTDRNSFLKRDELIENSRLIQASAASNMKLSGIGQEIGKLVNVVS